MSDKCFVTIEWIYTDRRVNDELAGQLISLTEVVDTIML